MTHTSRPLTHDTVVRLLLDTEPYLSCDDCFAQLDQYVEQLARTPGYDEPRMRAHLAGCGACAEEADSLLSLVLDLPR
jgi:hypothetical protein